MEQALQNRYVELSPAEHRCLPADWSRKRSLTLKESARKEGQKDSCSAHLHMTDSMRVIGIYSILEPAYTHHTFAP